MTDIGVVVTGGASGIGLACAEIIAAGGGRVGIIDVNPDAAAEAVTHLPGAGHVALPADVTDEMSVRDAIGRFADGGRITGVVAAAGIVSRPPFVDLSAEELRRTLDINVVGVHNVVRAAAPHLLNASPNSAVVILGSVAAYTGGGLMGTTAYATSKGAVVGLMRGYARELGPHGVRVNVVAPGPTETPMTAVLTDEERQKILASSKLGRFAEVSEIAGTVVFLLGRTAGAITGQVVHANGGVYFG